MVVVAVPEESRLYPRAVLFETVASIVETSEQANTSANSKQIETVTTARSVVN